MESQEYSMCYLWHVSDAAFFSFIISIILAWLQICVSFKRVKSLWCFLVLKTWKKSIIMWKDRHDSFLFSCSFAFIFHSCLRRHSHSCFLVTFQNPRTQWLTVCLAFLLLSSLDQLLRLLLSPSLAATKIGKGWLDDVHQQWQPASPDTTPWTHYFTPPLQPSHQLHPITHPHHPT